MSDNKDLQRRILCITSCTFGLWVGFLLNTLNLQEHFPAVQTFYPGNYRMLATPLGMLLGTLAAPLFLDNYKLREVVYFGAFISVLCCVVMPFAFAPEIILVDRTFFGFSMGLLLTKYCVFVSYAVPNQNVLGYTSFLVSGFAGGCALASLVAFIAYDEDIFSRNFRIPYFVGLVLCLGWTVWVSMFLPEGPWSFVKAGNDDAALRILAAFHGKPMNHEDIQLRLKQVKLADKQHGLKTPTLITPLTAKLRSKTLIAAILLFFTFASLPATLIFYGPKLLNTNFDGKMQITISLVFSCVFFVFSIFNRFIIYKFQRKNAMLMSAAALSLLSIVLCFLTVEKSIPLAIVTLCLCSGIASIWLSISLATVMQIFDDHAKSRSIAFSLACAWFGAILVLLFNILAPSLTVFMLAAISILSLVWIKITPLPEQHHLTAYQTSRNDLLKQDSTVNN